MPKDDKQPTAPAPVPEKATGPCEFCGGKTAPEAKGNGISCLLCGRKQTKK